MVRVPLYLPLVASLLAAVCLLPSAQAGVEVVSLDLAFSSPHEAVQTVVMSLSGEEATQIRAFMDANQDGAVTSDEAKVFEIAMARDADPSPDDPPSLTVDGKSPKNQTAAVTRMTGAVGSTRANGPLGVTLEMRLIFAGVAGERHSAVSPAATQEQAQKAGVFSSQQAPMQVHAPPGYVIASTDGLPDDAELSNRGRQIGFSQSLAPTEDQTFIFERSAQKGSPAPNLSASLLVLIGLAVVLRARSAAKGKI